MHAGMRSEKMGSDHGDAQRQLAPTTNRTHGFELGKLRDWLLPNGSIFSNPQLHGNTNWSPSPVNFAWLALCWAWSSAKNLTDAFSEARDDCREMVEGTPTTYQGFMHSLVVWTVRFRETMCEILQQRMSELGNRHFRVHGWLAIAFDGSRESVPRTKSNEEYFCAPNHGKGKTAKYRKKKTKGMRRQQNELNKSQPPEPQAWITMLWHMGLRLPWMWRLGPSNSAERTHVMEMIKQNRFPKKTLFCGDAGFVGYPLWSAIMQQGCDFLVRVGGNVRLLVESSHCDIDRNGNVLCWPDQAKRSKLLPLRLRLEKVRIKKTTMWMLTSVRSPSQLTNKEIVNLYQMRWGIEVEFRGLKQTLDRGKLRSQNAQRALAELNWSIMAMAVAELFATKEQIAASEPEADTGVSYNPSKRSLAQTMRVLRYGLRHMQDEPEPGKDIRTRLREAVTDNYQRKSSKKARYRPVNNDKKKLGEPQVRRLSEVERKVLDKTEYRSLAA